jgi:hypothetical protein
VTSELKSPALRDLFEHYDYHGQAQDAAPSKQSRRMRARAQPKRPKMQGDGQFGGARTKRLPARGHNNLVEEERSTQSAAAAAAAATPQVKVEHFSAPEERRLAPRRVVASTEEHWPQHTTTTTQEADFDAGSPPPPMFAISPPAEHLPQNQQHDRFSFPQQMTTTTGGGQDERAYGHPPIVTPQFRFKPESALPRTNPFAPSPPPSRDFPTSHPVDNWPDFPDPFAARGNRAVTDSYDPFDASEAMAASQPPSQTAKNPLFQFDPFQQRGDNGGFFHLGSNRQGAEAEEEEEEANPFL